MVTPLSRIGTERFRESGKCIGSDFAIAVDSLRYHPKLSPVNEHNTLRREKLARLSGVSHIGCIFHQRPDSYSLKYSLVTILRCVGVPLQSILSARIPYRASPR